MLRLYQTVDSDVPESPTIKVTGKDEKLVSSSITCYPQSSVKMGKPTKANKFTHTQSLLYPLPFGCDSYQKDGMFHPILTEFKKKIH